MSEEEKRNKQVRDKPQQISRREFAIGSMAILSNYSLGGAAAASPLSEEAQAMKLEKTDILQSYLETRHILDEDLKQVIDHAERTGKKLYRQGSDSFLSKLRVQEVYFYVEYAPIKEGYKIYTAYTHRFLLAGDK